jgi:hypothetical protein
MVILGKMYRTLRPGDGGSELEAFTLPIRQVPTICGLSIPSLYREASKGNIVLLKYGRTTLVDVASLRAFLGRLPRASIRPADEVA